MVIAAAGVAAAATIGGAAISSSAASSAADKQAEAAGQASDAQVQAAQIAQASQEKMYYQTRKDLQPYRQAGRFGLNRLQNQLQPGGYLSEQFGMDDFTKDPGYQFRVREGLKALDRSASAQGMQFSGRQLIGAQRYGQNMGSQEYGNAFNRFQTERTNRFNRLASLAGIGQTATNTLSNIGYNTGQGIANTQMAAGNARASGYINAGNAAAAGQVGQANAINSALGNVGNLAMNYAAYQGQQPQYTQQPLYNAGSYGYGPDYSNPSWYSGF